MSDEATLPQGDLFFLRPQGEAAPDRLLSYVIAEGDGQDDTTIFFCHGAGGNKNQWRHQWRHFAAQKRRLVAWDCLGHGQSHQPHDRRAYRGSLAVKDYMAIFRRFATGRNILVAHSYGCRLTLALLLALRETNDPRHVGGVLLLGAPPADSPLSLGPLVALPAFLLEALRPVLNAGFRRAAWHPETDPALIAHEERVSRRNGMAMIKALLSGALRLEPSRLAALHLPVEIAFGEADQLTPPAVSRELAAALPNARLHEVAGAGHQLMLERPEVINTLLETLLAVRTAEAL